MLQVTAKKARVFLPDKYFQPSLIIVAKARKALKVVYRKVISLRKRFMFKLG
jgi:hypothetical protein